ncbi:MAG: ABC transporter ATP-binding protein [Hespellia sp.]|jgi:putative ABC transport system ATP-binding protein|nr:ABC transporter ATP-binding protein [Hespellia sp.]
MGKVLRVEDLQKGQILNRVSFEMEQGELLAIMGPSGSGKSTLLYNVAGMDQPSGGRVWLNDTEITALTEDEKAKLRLHRIGFIFQQMNMVANLNILDNILLPAMQANKKCRTRSKTELIEEARNLMQKLSILGLEDRRITQVSGGQLQRACICRSLMNAPEIIFADEPTGALNRSAATEVLDELVRINGDGVSVLMVTHDSKVASGCDRILYLLDGRICDELRLGKRTTGTERRREEAVNRWLAEMGF